MGQSQGGGGRGRSGGGGGDARKGCQATGNGLYVRMAVVIDSFFFARRYEYKRSRYHLFGAVTLANKELISRSLAASCNYFLRILK